MTTAPLTPPGAPHLTDHRRNDVLVGSGVALLSAAIVLSTFYSRVDGDLDWSNFGVGIAATLALLVVAAAGVVRASDPDLKATLVSWPSAFGALGAGLMIAVAMDANDAAPWIVGLVVAALGAGGYVLVRRPAPALSVVVGLVVLYAKILDVVLDLGDSDNALMIGGAVILVFALAVTGASWLLPGRDVVAITVGAFTVFSFIALIASVSFAAFFFGGIAAGFSEDGAAMEDPLAAFHNDIYVLMFFSLILIAVWAVLSALTGHTGYRVLIVALVSTQLPLSIAVVGAEHPSWVGLAVVVIGALLLAAVAARILRADTRSTRPGPQAWPAPDAATPPPPPPPPYAG